MYLINSNIKWIMLISGGVAFTMIYAAIAPQQALALMFGSSLEGPLAEIIVRDWGALVAIIGGMLIYGAFSERNRNLVISVAVLTKITFISLVIINGLGAQSLIAISFDAIVVLLFFLYLLSNRRSVHVA